MTLLYASTFADALGKLSHNEQKQVKITTVDLMMDPRGIGISLERLNRAGDDKIWSARVSRSLRIILRRDGDDTLLAYVGQHDDAYQWAERRKFIPHERSGAMQIVEMVEQKETAPRSSPDASAETGEKRSASTEQPFWALSDDQMLDVGVPRDWLQPVRSMMECDLDSMFERLPAEAAEALYDFATGGKLEDHFLQPMEAGASAFAHPNAKRRFRVLDNIEELKAAMDAPFEKWAVFLHPAQSELVQRAASGPTRVSGSAGTGKTIVALHRAVHLAKSDPEARVLLTTFSQPLAVSLENKLDILTDAKPELRNRIAVRPLDQAATELYTKLLGQPNRVTGGQIRKFVKDALASGLGDDLTSEFLVEEWEELVDAWGVTTAEAYAEIPRIGRRTRLGSRQREAAWSVFGYVRQRMFERKLVSWAMMYSAITSWLANSGELPFDHVVVDEAQDLTVAQIRFLAEIGKSRPEAIFLAGDIGQRIFRLPFSWAKLGLDIRGRSHPLKVNYRTSHQIRTMADRLLPSELTDLDGVCEARGGTVSVFDGPAPEIVLAESETAERTAIADWLKRCIASGIEPVEIGILVRSNDQLVRVRAAAQAAGLDYHADPGIRIATMHMAKGLEFRAVAVVCCDEDVLPDPSRLAGIGDIADLEAIYETERQLLYVACTRARDRLLVSAVEPGSEFLDDLIADS